MNDRTQQEIREILTGGFTLLEDGENRLNMERFQTAINHIDGILGLDHTDDGIIHRRWERLTRTASSE